ncbi:MAG: OmpA family protein [Pseudomonadota bacterium]|nr:OmpA family protein [Pseudomonadota bacterium]
MADRLLARGFALALLAFPSAAAAVDVGFKLEPDVAIPLTAPQSERFGVGGGESLKVLFGLTPWLDIGPTASFHLLPASEPSAESGVVWGLGGGVRLKRPHDAEGLGGISPWLDADAFYMRTGELNRPGFDAAVGLAIPVGEARRYWIGPFVRYLHIGQPEERVGYDNRDAKLLTMGISFEVGSGIERDARPVAAVIEPVPCPACAEVVAAPVTDPDTDKDGLADRIDRCPDVAGMGDTWGCPAYKKVVVHADKLELKEKLYFEHDKARLEAASFPVLDEVVQALKDNKSFRVQVEGHTDSSGTNAHNQVLSEERAAAVLDYLVSHGIAKDRLVSKGFSSSVPVDTNATASGRENNRRVEFVVNFIILNDGSAK